MRKTCILIFITFFISRLHSQSVAVNTSGVNPDPSAMLDVGGNTRGLLIPRISLTSTSSAVPITSPAISLMVYNLATVSDVTPGYYYWNGVEWVRFFDGAINAADHDWYEVGGTLSPNSINDNIFTQGNVGVGTISPSEKLEVAGTLRLNGASYSLLKNLNSVNREELQIRAKSDAYSTGTDGSGINLYGDNDNKHGKAYNASLSGGPIAMLTGGDAHIIISADGKTAVGNSLWNRHDNQQYEGVLNVYDPSSVPGIFVKGASSSEGDFTVPSGEAISIGHWNESGNSFTNRVQINSLGNVGIGTASPTAKLTVETNANASTDQVLIKSPSAGHVLLAPDAASGNWNPITKAGDAALIFSDGLIGTGGLAIAPWNANLSGLRMDSEGNVGIGATTPVGKLNIAYTNDASFSSVSHPLTIGQVNDLNLIVDNNEILARDNGGAATLYIQHETGAGNTIINSKAGNVGISTASPDRNLVVGNGNVKISGHGISTDSADILLKDAGVIAADLSLNLNIDANNIGSGDVRFGKGTETALASNLMVIKNGGNVGIGTTSPSQKLEVVGNILASGTITPSDNKYKKEIKEITSASSIIDKLRPVSYLFKSDEFQEGRFDKRKHYGVIAQEIEKVLPELVYTDNGGFKAVNYTELIAILIQSEKEQKLLFDSKLKSQEQKFSLELESRTRALEEKFQKEMESLRKLILKGE